MRLFIAVELPESFKDYLMSIQKQFYNLGTISFTRDYHCTLKFLGEVNETNLERTKELLRHVKIKKFSLTLDSLGVFPSENYMKVIWIGLNGSIDKLQECIDSTLETVYPKERDFKAHLTLGRVKCIKDKRAIKEKLGMKISEMSFEVAEFKLIKSALTPSGPFYETLEVYSLD